MTAHLVLPSRSRSPREPICSVVVDDARDHLSDALLAARGTTDTETLLGRFNPVSTSRYALGPPASDDDVDQPPSPMTRSFTSKPVTGSENVTSKAAVSDQIGFACPVASVT